MKNVPGRFLIFDAQFPELTTTWVTFVPNFVRRGISLMHIIKKNAWDNADAEREFRYFYFEFLRVTNAAGIKMPKDRLVVWLPYAIHPQISTSIGF
jgi:hypothetical protein